MKDRFKFRVWDKRSNQMHYNDFIVTATGFISAINHCSNDYMTMYFKQNDLETDKNCVLMQCTGLKDKNGILIYEGDIVKHGLHNCLVEWYKGGFWVNGFINGAKWEMHQYHNTLEVIGNIYENKDLLNENS